MEGPRGWLDPELKRTVLARQPLEYEINVEYKRPPAIVSALDDPKSMDGIVMPTNHLEVGCCIHEQFCEVFPGSQAARRKGSTSGAGF